MNSTNTGSLTFQINPKSPDSELINEAVSILQNGEMIIIPTDTVYGIGMLALPEADISQLFTSKHRPRNKNIPLLVADAEDLRRYGSDVPEYALELAKRHWPGALTLVVKASEEVPAEFVAADGSIALRMPANNIALELIKTAGSALICSSANISGEAPATRAQDLSSELRGSVALVIDGGTIKEGKASTVVSCLGAEPIVLRQGPVKIRKVKS